MTRSTTIPALTDFAAGRTILLTTYRRAGTPVPTPVHVALAGDRVVARTYDAAGKSKRLRHTSEVSVAPSTVRGKPTGPSVRARIRWLDGAEAAGAARALRRKYPVLHGVLIPFFHRVRGYKTLHMELTQIPE